MKPTEHKVNFREIKERCSKLKLSGDLILEIGRLFLNAPYQAKTLESPGRERLRVNFTQFDCLTFVETVLALARCAERGKMSIGEFRSELQFIRYRGGVINGFASRLHYFTDWLRDNEKKKVLKDMSPLLAGVGQRKKINYMTVRRENYPALKNEKEFLQIGQAEKSLSRQVFSVICKNKISAQSNNIKEGDVVAFFTHQEGLDVAHAGFAIGQGGRLHLLHASSALGAVVISTETLASYAKKNKKYSGIFVARVSLYSGDSALN